MPAAANAKAAMALVPQFSKAAFVGGAGIKLDSFAQAAQGGGPVFAGVSFEDTTPLQQFKINYLSSGYSANEYGPYTASASDLCSDCHAGNQECADTGDFDSTGIMG